MGTGILDGSIVNPAFWPNSPANIYTHNEGMGGGDTMATGGSNWIERDGYRFDQLTGEMEQKLNGAWVPVMQATSFYDPRAGISDNERLQLALGMANAPSGTDINKIREWSVNSGGFKEPSRNSGMTLGEALLMMGGAAMGAGALNGLGTNSGFIDAIGSGVGAGSPITGALPAAGSGAMDWTDVLGDFPGSSATDGVGNSIADLMNANAGASAVTPTTVSNWLQQTLGINPISSVGQSLLKSLIGGSAGGSGSSGNSLLGTALGGLLGSLNGSKQAGTTTVTQEPWSGQQPYLLDAFKKAQAAANGSSLQTQANTNYQSVLSGPTTNPMLGMDNPYLTSAINNANADVTRAFMPAVNQANRASGSFGNSGVADTYGKNMADAYSRNATTMRMQDYTNQQNLQQQAVNNTLGFTSNANNYAAQPSQNYAQTVQGHYGGQTTTPYYNNPLSGIMGGAMVGNSIGSNLGF